MKSYSNRPVNKTWRGGTSEGGSVFAALLLTASVILTLAAAKRMSDPSDSGELSDVAEAAYAAAYPEYNINETATEADLTASETISDIIP